jgi:antitoxin (DNA-binding transcriptional repressor) of toxin-antitoxin stability system
VFVRQARHISIGTLGGVSKDVSIRELHEHTAEVLRRVEAGEHIRVVRDDEPIAELAPPEDTSTESGPQTWVPRERYIDLIGAFDPGMRADIQAVYDRLDGR